jgi:hypothetical protein
MQRDRRQLGTSLIEIIIIEPLLHRSPCIKKSFLQKYMIKQTGYDLKLYFVPSSRHIYAIMIKMDPKKQNF